MSQTQRNVSALFVLLCGLVVGWAVWSLAYPALEPLAVNRFGGPGGALVLWALLGIALVVGYVAAFRVAARLLRQPPARGLAAAAEPGPAPRS